MNTGKILNAVNNKTLQKAAGAYIYFDSIGKTTGLSGGVEVLEAIVREGLSRPHVPNLNNVMSDLIRGGIGHQQLQQYLKVFLLGEGLKIVGIGSKYGNILSNFAKNAAIGTIMGSVALYSTAWNSPTAENNYAGASAYWNKSVRQNFNNANPVNTYNY